MLRQHPQTGNLTYHQVHQDDVLFAYIVRNVIFFDERGSDAGFVSVDS